MTAFDETPPNQMCQKVEETIRSIRSPNPPEKSPFLTAPNEHFIYTRVLSNYPDDLYNLSHEGSIVSGWIQEISSFWAANMYSLFIFPWDLSSIKSSPITSPVVCVGLVDGYLIAAYNTGISIFNVTDSEIQPLRTKYSTPENISITTIKYGIAGCNDGSLRKITINPKKCSVSISGIFTLKEDDPVIQIIRTQNYFVALTLNSNISVFENKEPSIISSVWCPNGFSRLASFTEIKNILNIWCPSGDEILAIDSNAILYSFTYQKYKLTLNSECELIGRRQFQTALFDHGVLVAVDNDRAQFDSLLTARFGSSPVYTINRDLGGIHSIGATTSDFKIFSSSGIYTITEKVTDEREEIWRFCNIINKFWDKSIMEIDDDSNNQNSWLIEELNSFVNSDFEFLSILSTYVLTIIDDTKVLKGSKAEKYISNTCLSDFFTIDRNNRFSLLRLISFETRNKNQLEFSLPEEGLAQLIEKARLGNDGAANEALSIITSYKKLPPYYPFLCQFMFESGFYRELIECVIQWADSVLSDDKALAFENANFPWRDEQEIYAYHLRSNIYKQLTPLLNLAVGKDREAPEECQKKAISAFKYSLNMSIKVFQTYILEFLEENCPEDRITEFFYPDMISEMKNMGSRLLPTVLISKSSQKAEFKREAFNIYIEKASLEAVDENNNYTIEERIEFLNKALNLFSNDEKALKLKRCAEILKEFLLSHPNESQNLFALDVIDINEVLLNNHEYRLALKVMDIFGEKRFDVLDNFLKEADQNEVKEFLKECIVFTPSEIAHEIYNLKKEDAFDFMFDCEIDNFYIFQVLCELWRSGKYRDGVNFIKNVLNRAGPINREIREDLADVLCEITLELDSRNNFEDANIIRANLKHCFLEQSFTDINDL